MWLFNFEYIYQKLDLDFLSIQIDIKEDQHCQPKPRKS